MVELSTKKLLFTFGLGSFSKMASIIKNTDYLPQKPNYFIKLLRLAYNSKTSRSEFSAELNKDSELKSKILNLPTMPGRNPEMNKEDFEKAVQGLEKSFIESLLEVDFAKRFHSAISDKVTQVHLEKWNKSIKSAIIASNISTWVNYPNKEFAFFGALLADLPTLIMTNYDSKARTKVDQLIQDGMSEREAEVVAYGFDHYELGSKLFQYYSLPGTLVDMMNSHYQAEKSRDKTLTKIVNFSRFLAECFSDKCQSPSSIWSDSQKSINDLGLQISSEEWGNKISLLFVKSIEFEMRVLA
jgi:HD-like signal output (HDOD) protein